jgi:hypothetical protein
LSSAIVRLGEHGKNTGRDRGVLASGRMKRLALVGCVAGTLLLGSGQASAETVPLGSKQDTSHWPGVLVSTETLERPESFVVTLSAEPPEELQFLERIRCGRTYGSETAEHESSVISVTPPTTITILPTLAEPETCSIEVSAWTGIEIKGTPVTVKMEVTGNRRAAPPPITIGPGPVAPTPAWARCSAPAFLTSGRTEDHGGGCAEAQRIATKAWHEPARLGKNVKVSTFSCRRLQQGRQVTIHCADDDQIIKVIGQLR